MDPRDAWRATNAPASHAAKTPVNPLLGGGWQPTSRQRRTPVQPLGSPVWGRPCPPAHQLTWVLRAFLRDPARLALCLLWGLALAPPAAWAESQAVVHGAEAPPPHGEATVASREYARDSSLDGSLHDALEDARAAWERGERRSAVELLEGWLAEHPESSPGWLELAGWRSRIRRHEGALEALAQLPEDVAKGAAASRLRGEALYALGRLAEALNWLDPELETHSNYRLDALESLGRTLELAAELEHAGKLFGADRPEILLRRGQLALRAGDPQGARAHFERALDLDDLELRAMFGLGTALVRLGERELGLEHLSQHRRLLPLLDAVHFAQESLAIAPNHAPNYVTLAEAWRDMGRLDRAEQAFRQALPRTTVDDAAPVGLRWARFLEEHRSDPQAAVDHLDRVATQLPQDPRLPVRAGDILARAGDKPGAAQRFRIALKLRPGDAQIEARLAKVQ